MKTYCNLTNGLEWADEVAFDGHIRIQSSHLEGGHLWHVLADLDYGFLFALLRDGAVAVYDSGSRRRDGVSRALWQGCAWIEFAIARSWGIEATPGDARQLDAFRRAWDGRYGGGETAGRALAKLAYMRKLFPSLAAPPKIETVSRKSRMDGAYGEFARLQGVRR